jgi:hypothetical protein
MNPKTLPVATVLVFQVACVALLIAAARNPKEYGFLLLGGAVGWLLYFFMRKYKIFSPKSLAATLSAVLGGEGLAWLSHLRGGSAEVELQYFTGLGVGFFAYALYAGLCSWLFAIGAIGSVQKFEIAVACGAGIGEEIDRVEALMEFEMKALEWHGGILSNEQFRAVIDDLEISRRQIAALIKEGQVELSKEILERLREEKMLPLMKDV